MNNQLTVVTLEQLLDIAFPPREEILAPIITTQSLTMLHAWRGIGKTHLVLGVAHAISTGSSFLKWSAPFPSGILYLDGEMPGIVLQERLEAIVAASGKEPPPGYFRIATPDLQKNGVMPDLSTPDGQSLVDEMVTPETKLIIVDNVSCLCRTGKENESEGWIPVQGWALRQRAMGRAVLFVHHSGKSGEQRGASKREDTLDTVIKLVRPAEYEPSQGAAFQIVFEKARFLKGADVSGFEARLTINQDTELQEWVVQDLAQSSFERVVALANDGLTQSEIAVELGLHKSNVSRNLKKAAEHGLLSPCSS